MKTRVFLVATALALGGCGSDDDGNGAETEAETTPGPPADTATFDARNVGFIFQYPKDLEATTTPEGQIVGQVAVEEGGQLNAIKIRKTAEQELGPDRYLDEFERDFEKTVGKVEKREDTIGGLEVGVLEFEDSIEQDGEETEFSSTSYFFAGGGKTWQVECIADDEHADEIEDACRIALESVEFK